ncbi:MAG: hypothetical protein QW600_02710 [Candidatus Bathyarchaeia archaeon]|nr:hypothetical protein [Candidatus Bathyarchaeota archaeon]
MRKAIVLAFLGLAILSALIISAYTALAWYSALDWYSGHRWIERKAISLPAKPQCTGDIQNFTWNFRRGWRWALGDECGRWKVAFKGSFGKIELELSEEFRERVLEIAGSDGDVRNLLNNGYNVSCIRPVHMKGVVQESGQVTIEVEKVLLILTKNGSNRAFVEIDFKAGRVTRITIVSVTVIDKSTSA